MLEPTDHPASSLFGHYVLKDLQIDVPDTRTLCYTGQEMNKMVWELEKFTFVDIEYQKRILGLLNRPYWLVRQYYPHVTMD